MNNVNPLENVQKILKKSCELLNLDDSLYDLLKEPERTIEISLLRWIMEKLEFLKVIVHNIVMLWDHIKVGLDFILV